VILLLQVAGFLAAGAVVSAALTRRTGVVGVATALGVLAVALGYVAFASHAFSIGKVFDSQRAYWATLTPAQEELAGTPGIPGAFVEWIRGRIRPHETFYIVPSPTTNDAITQWYTYRLLPNLEVDHPRNADLLIFFGTTPKRSGYASLVSGPVQRFDKTSSIARTHHAG
jgi:hypothetical protein